MIRAIEESEVAYAFLVGQASPSQKWNPGDIESSPERK